MNRFEIVKRTAEVKWNDRFNIIPGCTEHDEEPEVIETFDNLGAAIKEYLMGEYYAYESLMQNLDWDKFVELHEKYVKSWNECQNTIDKLYH